MHYSKTTGGFYTRDIHGENMPADVVEITAEEHAALLEGQSRGKCIVGDANGRPALQDPAPSEPPTGELIEAQRLRAYADPLTGSDRLFSEAMRMQIMSEEGYQDVRARAIARFEEIQAQYPWKAI